MSRESPVKAYRERPRSETASQRHARETRAAWWAGLSVSALLHLLVLVLWRGAIPLAPAEPALPANPDRAGGGGAMRAIAARLPASIEVPPPPRPVAAIEAPDIEVDDLEVSVSGLDLIPAAGVALPGIGGGVGEGEGGEGSGEDDFRAPMPRSVLPRWDPPSSVRGLEVTVRIHVDERGEPTGEVYLDPPTPDRKFNREIRESVRRMAYRPALRNGTPVAAWAEITFIF